MSSLNQLFTSFIKGIAKTTGTLTVLSVAAILWQLYTNENNFQSTILPFKSPEPKGEEADLECSFIDCNNMENQGTEDFDKRQGTFNIKRQGTTNQNFKKIFDRL
jgi:hypothetical protein